MFARLPPDVHEVILAGGHSIDGTMGMARQLLRNVRLIRQSGTGKGSAVACGFAAARGDIIVMLDADGSTDPAGISSFVAALRTGADFVKGSRFLPKGGSDEITAFRSFGNLAVSAVVNVLYGVRYTELCYGYSAFWRHCLSQIAIDCGGFEVETLMNIRVAKTGLKVIEVPSHESCRIRIAGNLLVYLGSLDWTPTGRAVGARPICACWRDHRGRGSQSGATGAYLRLDVRCHRGSKQRSVWSAGCPE